MLTKKQAKEQGLNVVLTNPRSNETVDNTRFESLTTTEIVDGLTVVDCGSLNPQERKGFPAGAYLYRFDNGNAFYLGCTYREILDNGENVAGGKTFFDGFYIVDGQKYSFEKQTSDIIKSAIGLTLDDKAGSNEKHPVGKFLYLLQTKGADIIKDVEEQEVRNAYFAALNIAKDHFTAIKAEQERIKAEQEASRKQAAKAEKQAKAIAETEADILFAETAKRLGISVEQLKALSK